MGGSRSRACRGASGGDVGGGRVRHAVESKLESSAGEHRGALVVSSREALLERLEVAAQGKSPLGAVHGEPREPRGTLAWLFTGQGAQVAGMGRGLYEAWPAFREALTAAFESVDAHLPRPLREVMWAEAGARKRRRCSIRRRIPSRPCSRSSGRWRRSGVRGGWSQISLPGTRSARSRPRASPESSRSPTRPAWFVREGA